MRQSGVNAISDPAQQRQTVIEDSLGGQLRMTDTSRA